MYNYGRGLTPSCAIHHFLLFSTRSSNRDRGSQRVNDRGIRGRIQRAKNKARCPPIYLFRTIPTIEMRTCDSWVFPTITVRDASRRGIVALNAPAIDYPRAGDDVTESIGGSGGLLREIRQRYQKSRVLAASSVIHSVVRSCRRADSPTARQIARLIRISRASSSGGCIEPR